ncbi:MAG: hypothetical protein J0H81_12960 [Sphingopyxis terrae]|nr:hypothetical protein [Sphingopyxis terrae]
MCSLINANAQAGTTVRLRLGTSQAQVDGGSAPYDSGAVTFISPAETTDSGLYSSFQQFAEIDATWWRIDIGNHTGDFEAASLILGKAVQSSRFYDRGWELGTSDLGSIDISRWGVDIETDGIVLNTVSFKLSWVSEAEFISSFRQIMLRAKRKPVWLLFNPEAVAGRQAHFYFGRFGQAPFAQSVRKPGTFAGQRGREERGVGFGLPRVFAFQDRCPRFNSCKSHRRSAMRLPASRISPPMMMPARMMEAPINHVPIANPAFLKSRKGGRPCRAISSMCQSQSTVTTRLHPRRLASARAWCVQLKCAMTARRRSCSGMSG